MTEQSRSVSLLRSRRWILAILLMGLAVLIDFRFLERQTLWADELFSLAMATGHSLEQASALVDEGKGDFKEAAVPESLESLRHYITHDQPPAGPARVIRAVFLSDTSPPLYYLLLNRWTIFAGTSDRALRAFSLLWFVASIPLLLATANRLGGVNAELGSGLLYILSPGCIYTATEGRMYSLLWFCLLSTALLTLRLRDGRKAWWINALWILASAAGFLVHYFFLFPWCALVGWMALQPGRESRRQLGLNLILVLLCIAPWFRYLPASLHHWRITQDWLNVEPPGFSRSGAILDRALQFFSNSGHYFLLDRIDAKFVSAAAFGLLGVVMIVRLRGLIFAQNRLMFWGWYAAAIAGPIIFDLARHTYTVAVPRYTSAAIPASVLLAGLGLSFLDRRARIALLALILSAWVSGIRSMYRSTVRSDQPYGEFARLVSPDASASDLILVHSIPTGVLGVARYTESNARIADWVEQLGNRKTPEAVLTLAHGFRRIFFIRVHASGTLAPEESWLREHARLGREIHLGSALFLEFSPRENETF